MTQSNTARPTLALLANAVGTAHDNDDARARSEALEAVRVHLAAHSTPDGIPDDELQAAIDASNLASAANTEAEALEAFKGVTIPELPPATVYARRDQVLTGEKPLLSVAGKSAVLGGNAEHGEGAVLEAGEVLVLSGSGGAGKSTVARDIALSMGCAKDDAPGKACGGVFAVTGGRALLAVYEDKPEKVCWRLTALARVRGEDAQAALDAGRVGVLDLSSGDGWPLYGPPPGGHASDPPVPLKGWAVLWRRAEKMNARIVVIDPLLSSFHGEANSPRDARVFLGALAREAERHGAGVLLIAHSSKAARGFNADIFDPGQVGGSSHWTDGTRGAMAFDWDQRAVTERGKPPRYLNDGKRALAVLKANAGPSRIVTLVDVEKPKSAPKELRNTPVGIVPDGDWMSANRWREEAAKAASRPAKEKRESKSNGNDAAAAMTPAQVEAGNAAALAD